VSNVSTAEQLSAAQPLPAVRDEAAGRSHRRFASGYLAGCLGVLAAVLAFNVLVDPFALAGTRLVPTAVEQDRSLKLDLLQRLTYSPQILIMGSSRSRQAEPAFLQKLTGLTGFNAGVTGGTSADEYVFARYTADLFPHKRRRYLWFTDVGIAGGGVLPQLAQDPRARPYLLSGGPTFGLGDVKTYLSTDATKASWRVFTKCVLGPCRRYIRFRPDGSLTNQSLHYLPEHTKSLHAAVSKLIGAMRENPVTLAEARASIATPGRFDYFDRALAFMNRRGEVPVIVLNPIYPSVFAEARRQGFPWRRATLEKFAQLHKRYRFVLVDCENERKWGGTASDWSNPTHVNRSDMRRMLRYIVAHSDGELR
jgi:hypothetical protein